MKNIRNRLLILLALLTIGLAPMPRSGYAMGEYVQRPSGGGWTIGPYSGEPDTPNSRNTTTTHGAVTTAPSDQATAGSVVIPRAMWWRWVIRIWAATHFGVGQ